MSKFIFPIILLLTIKVSLGQTVDVNIVSNWGTGYQAKLEITPNKDVIDWEVQINFTGTLSSSAWNADFTDNNVTNILTITPKNGAQNISSATLTSFEFNATDNGIPSVKNYILYYSDGTNSNGNGNNNSNDYWTANGTNLINQSSYTSIDLNAKTNIGGFTTISASETLGNDVLQLRYPNLVNGRNHYMFFANRFFNSTSMYSVIGGYSQSPTSGGSSADEGPTALVLQPQIAGGNLGVGYFKKEPEAKLTINSGSNKKSLSILNPNEKEVCRITNSGLIYATEVKVQLNPFPDYVFANDYNLTPLDSLEEFITREKHLPKTPSAQEIKETNIGIGELTRLQQEKIEELTLYIIELQKKIDKINNKLNKITKIQE